MGHSLTPPPFTAEPQTNCRGTMCGRTGTLLRVVCHNCSAFPRSHAVVRAQKQQKIKDITIRQVLFCNTCLRGAPPQLNKPGFMLPRTFKLKLGNIVIYAPRQTVALLFVCGQCCKSVSSNVFFFFFRQTAILCHTYFFSFFASV